MKQANAAKQVLNLLALLEYFSQRQRPATMAEIADDLGWPRSSTHKLLSTLGSQGYLYEPSTKGGYYPSSLWRHVIADIEAAAPLPESAHSLLQDIVAQTQETAVLAGLSGGSALFLACLESPHAVRYTAAAGKTVPLHATATGRALLAQLPPASRANLLKRAHFERYTGTTLMSVQAVEDEIARSVHRGWFAGQAEYSQDLGGLALPIQWQGRHYALLVAGPVMRMQDKLVQFANILRQSAEHHGWQVALAPPSA